MTADQRPPSGDAERAAQLRAAAERSEELRATHRRLALRHAEVEERAGQVHDEAARVHAALGSRCLLDPAQLSAHADQDRARAALERRRAAGQADGTTPTSGDAARAERADEEPAPPPP